MSHARRCRQRGQAMTEMVVGLGMVFVIAFFAMAMLGKLNDVHNKVLIGSRYVAWERTVWTSPDDVAPGSDADWYAKFGAGAAGVSKSDRALAGEWLARVAMPRRGALGAHDAELTLSATLPPSWQDFGGKAFIASAGDISVATRASGGLTRALSARANVPLGTYTGQDGTRPIGLQMATDTVQGARLGVRVRLGGEFAKRLWPNLSQLTFDDTTVLVTNPWAPDGRLGLVSAIGPEKATPAADGTILDDRDRDTLIRAVPGTEGVLKRENFSPGRIEADVVPPGALQ